MSNGIDVFNEKIGLRRYIDFFDSYERYQQKKQPTTQPQEIKVINPTPNFLEG